VNLNLKEQLFAENKLDQPGSARWTWEMTRTIAALYNSGGGILRVGVDDNGNPIGLINPQDYSADKSPLASVLHRYLDPVPPYDPRDKGQYVEIVVREGVTSPSILREELVEPQKPKDRRQPKKYPVGTVFIRRMNGSQPSSEPLRTRSDWQTALNLWEANRGVTLQGPLIAQFCLVVNKWNPFDRHNTELTVWETLCIADAAETLGREELRAGLKAIIGRMRPSPTQPPAGSDKNQAGADYKKPFLDEVRQLCDQLGLLPRH